MDKWGLLFSAWQNIEMTKHRRSTYLGLESAMLTNRLLLQSCQSCCCMLSV